MLKSDNDFAQEHQYCTAASASAAQSPRCTVEFAPLPWLSERYSSKSLMLILKHGRTGPGIHEQLDMAISQFKYTADEDSHVPTPTLHGDSEVWIAGSEE